MKKITIPLIIAVIFCMTASSVLALSLSGFNPIFKTQLITKAGKNKFYNARGQFTTKLALSANQKKNKVIVPADERFKYGVVRISDSAAKSKILSGTKMSVSEAKKNAARWGNGVAKSHWWFKASSHPKVQYTGYQIWDVSRNKYVKLKVTAQLKDYTKSNGANAQKEARGATPAIMFTNSSASGYFNGLPSLIITGIGTAHVQFKFYDASTGEPYSIRQNIMYYDIDAYQAISIKKSNSAGFTAYKTPNLKFGAISDVYAIQANRGKMTSSENRDYWMSYNIIGKTVDMYYTSDQKEIKNSKMTKPYKPGKPDGAWSHFLTRTYSPVVSPKLAEPYKRVYDDIPKDDVKKQGDAKYGTHNQLNKISQTFYYDIVQPIPSGMTVDSSYKLANLTFYDKVDECVKITAAPTFHAKVGNKETNVTKYFEKKTYTNRTVKYSLKATDAAHKEIYKASQVRMRVNAQVKTDEAGLYAHKHKFDKNKLLYDIPNTATVTYKPSGKNAVAQNTNTVKTRVQGIPKHDLSITKNVTDDALPVDTDKEFAFQINLNNGSRYKWELKKGSTVVKSGETAFNKGYTAQIKHGETFTIKQIPGSVTYNIKEEVPEHYRVTVTKGTNSATTDTITGSEISGTIKDVQNNDAISYTYRNTHEVSEHILRVKKQVNGENGTFPFTIKLSGLKPGENYKSFPTEEDYYAHNDFATMGYGYPDYSFSNNIATSDGKLTINVNLSDGEEFLLTGIPDTAKYQIIEGETAGYKATFEAIDRENPQVLPDVGQTVHMLPNTDYTGVKTKTGTGEKGKGVSTPEETFTVTGHDYTREYLVTNSEENSHELVLHKKLEGGNPDDEFNFSVKFTGLKGKTIGAQFFTWGGEREPFNSIPARNTSETVSTQEFTLKANQYIVFSNIPENAKYEVTEVNNDYIASYTGARTDEDGEKTNFNGGNDKPNKDLTFGETLPEGNTKTEYDITNTAVIEPERTSLEVEKVTTDASKDEFNFTANFENLEPNHTYAVFSETGDTEYEVVNDNGTIVVRTGLGTIGNPHEFVNGVPIIVKRANGKERTIFSGASDNLADLDGWHKGTYTLSPAVGTVMTGEFVSFTANDSGEATVNFKGSNDKTATFSGLPVGTKYRVTELTNSFAPAYQVIREKETLDKGDGEAGQDLQMSKAITLTKETDKVKFVNDKRSHMLRTEKKVEGGTDQFDFTAIIKNLTKEWYMAMVPGEGNFELGMNSQGIKITTSNYSGSIKDIPIKLIRPIDGAERVFYTDENGLVPKSEFEKWLSKGQDGSYKFKLEWNGGYVNGSYEAEEV